MNSNNMGNHALLVIQVCNVDHLSYTLYGIRHQYSVDISAWAEND